MPPKHQTDGRRTLRFASESTKNSQNLRKRPKWTKRSKTTESGRANNRMKVSTKTKSCTKALLSVSFRLQLFRHSIKMKNFHFKTASSSIRKQTHMCVMTSTELLGQFGQPALAKSLRQAAVGFQSSDMARLRSKPRRPHREIARQ